MKKMFVGRLKENTENISQKLLHFLLQQVGVPYDDEYLYDNGKYYCSELIYDAFLFAYKKPLFNLYPMTFKSPKSNEFLKFGQTIMKIKNGNPRRSTRLQPWWNFHF